MTDKNITIGHVINVTGMIGVSSGVLLFTFGIVHPESVPNTQIRNRVI
jgi:hypothetical protein